MTTTDASDDLNPTEAAAVAKCSERTLLRWVGRGLLPARRVVGTRRIMIDRAALDRFLKGQPVTLQPAALPA